MTLVMRHDLKLHLQRFFASLPRQDSHEMLMVN